MRYIDLKQLLKDNPGKWFSGYVGNLWEDPELKKAFRDYGHNKCWYTEKNQSGSYSHIDHWRPKDRLDNYERYKVNEAYRGGYTHLRNDVNNYRVSCAMSNSGHKKCYFPLFDALNSIDISQEKPVLIDPCNKDDVRLINFSGGKAQAAYTMYMDKDKNTRAKASIAIYGLNDGDIVASRHRVFESVKRIIDDYIDEVKAVNEYDISDDIKNDFCLRKRQHTLENLRHYIKREAEFSACAISCIISYASVIPDIIAALKKELIL